MACDAPHPEPALAHVRCQVPDGDEHADHFWRSRGGIYNEVFVWRNEEYRGVVPVPGKPYRDALVPDLKVRLEMQRRLAGQGRVGFSHPDTSIEAAKQELRGQRQEVYDFIVGQGPHGATAAEIVAAGVQPNVQLAGARLGELRDAGLIERRVDTNGRTLQRALPMQRPGAIHWASA